MGDKLSISGVESHNQILGKEKDFNTEKIAQRVNLPENIYF